MSKKLSALVTLTFLVAACTKKKPDANVLRMRLPGEPPSLDWNLATDNVSKEVIQNIQEGLLQNDANAHIRPAMAESWTISPDGLTYTFKLRDGLKWSDGQPLVAQHFVDSWERLLNPKTASEYAYFLFTLQNGEEYQKGAVKDFAKVGVKATDAKTLVVTLKNPAAYWINIPTFWVTYPIRKDLIQKYGDKWTEPGNMVSAGPYLLKEWAHESRLLLESNPNYPKLPEAEGRPPKAEFRVIQESSTAVALFDGGSLDIVRDLPPVQLPALAKRQEFVVSPYLRGMYIGFNIRDPLVADVRVRQALAHAVNRDEIKSIKALEPLITADSSWIPATLIGRNPDRGLKYDLPLAKKLWADIPDRPSKIELWFDQNDVNKIVAENVQSQWRKNLGLDAQLNNQEYKVYLKTIKTKTPPLFREGWGADYPDPDTFMNLFTCGSGNNFTSFCDKTYDKLVNTAGQRGTDAERAAAYDGAQKILLENQVVIIPLFTQTNLHLVTQRVSGFRVNPMGDFFFKELRLK